MTNLDNLKKWTGALREPGRVQITGHLAAYVLEPEVTIGNCCMGVGCDVAGIYREEYLSDAADFETDFEDVPVLHNEDGSLTDLGREETVFYYGEGLAELPPIEFAEWLGLDNAADGGDLVLDAPSDLTYRNDATNILGLKDEPLNTVGLATMNDVWRLTFPQIADLIDYFGVKGT